MWQTQVAVLQVLLTLAPGLRGEALALAADFCPCIGFMQSSGLALDAMASAAWDAAMGRHLQTAKFCS